MSKSSDLVQECKRLSESCLYTSTSLFIWLRSRRRIKTFFIVTPLALSAAASWRVLTEADTEAARILVSALALLAGVFPTIYAALKYDDELANCEHAAAEFKNLQDRFRQVALVGSKKPFSEFEAEFKQLVERLELARHSSLTPPERFFKKAQQKVKAGDYEFDVDEANSGVS
jgi:hypothetical protein